MKKVNEDGEIIEPSSLTLDSEGKVLLQDGQSYAACGTDSIENNAIVAMLRLILRFFAVAIGVVVTGVLALAGIQYASARGNPQGIAAAKGRIFKAVTALMLYVLGASILNFIVPGGILQ